MHLMPISRALSGINEIVIALYAFFSSLYCFKFIDSHSPITQTPQVFDLSQLRPPIFSSKTEAILALSLSEHLHAIFKTHLKLVIKN